MRTSKGKPADVRTLRRMAGARSFERGEVYAAEGRVGDLVEFDERITAPVAGTETYRVELWGGATGLEFSCTCPVGRDGAFCKHCVAVGLAWLERRRGQPQRGKTGKVTPAVTMDEVRSHLETWEKDRLVRVIVEQAVYDDDLRRQLLMEAATRTARGVDLATYRDAIDSAVQAGRFVDYHSMYAYARGIARAIDALEDLLREGRAVDAIDLTEHALAAVERAMGSVDDSDGEMGGLLERLQALHLKACRKAKPDPEVLARRLFDWELRTDWDTFYGASVTYADVLGARGLATYHRLAEAKWAKVPALGPGREHLAHDAGRFRLTHIMETLAEQTGEVEALVAVLKRDLSLPYSYLRIAEAYKHAGQRNVAVNWAERGLKAFPKQPDSRLREFLAEEYQRTKRHDEAMALMWAEFEDARTLERYQVLKRHAERAHAWPVWREKALALLRDKAARSRRAATRAARWGWDGQADRSELVRILLWEKDVESAWREAKEGGCSAELWMTLAAKREKAYPEDALGVYQAQIEPTLERKNNVAYQGAIGLIRKVRALMIRLDRGADVAPYLASLRAVHKPKRNFMALLDRAQWE